MVPYSLTNRPAASTLSVLALSSRFDGHIAGEDFRDDQYLSVLALSSRFDGPADLRRLAG